MRWCPRELNSLYHDATWCDWTVDQKTIILRCIYRSPSDVQSCETILHLLNEVSEISDNVLITGDFNYKDINWEDLTTIHNETHPEYKLLNVYVTITGACNHRTGTDRIGGNYRIGPNFPLVYEFYVTFLEYLWPNRRSNHIGSLVGDQCRAYLSLK